MAQKTRVLTDKQKLFLNHLFGEAKGVALDAKRMAGYGENMDTSDILMTLKDEIIDRTKMFLAENAPKAAFAFISGMDDPTQFGLREKLGAAKEVLDRIGLVKTERVTVETTSGVMLLPPKRAPVEDSDEYDDNDSRRNA
jgi:hypothetical protein